MLTMAQMPYVIGHKVRIYPSDTQKRIISVNDGVNRFIYNKLVERHNELHQLSKVNTYLKVVEDRKDYLHSLGEKATDFKAAYSFLEEKDVDGQAIENAKRHYSAAWNNFKKVPGTSIPTYHKKGYELIGVMKGEHTHRKVTLINSYIFAHGNKIRTQVAVIQHNAFCHARGAGGEKYCGSVIGVSFSC
jgi:hypothetical protein